MKKVFLFMAVAFSVLMLNSCSKNNSPDLNKIKTAKFTVQVSGLQQNDFASFSFSSGTSSSSTVWKINGTERTNEGVVSVDEDVLLSGTTYVIELTKPVVAISAGYQFTNGDNAGHTPITFSYKAEINGEVVKDIKNQPIASATQLNIDYSYP